MVVVNDEDLRHRILYKPQNTPSCDHSCVINRIRLRHVIYGCNGVSPLHKIDMNISNYEYYYHLDDIESTLLEKR